MTTTTAFLLLGIAALFLIFTYLTPREKSLYTSSEPELRPYLSKSPLTQTETIFYHRLVEALPEHIVLAQVQLSSFLKVDRSQTEWKDYYRWFNPISQQSVDFLICQKDFSIVAAVELDDKNHIGSDSIKRDTKKNNHLEAANVPLIRWHAEAMPETETIKQSILKLASGNATTTLREPEWLPNELPDFLRKKPDPIKPILVNISVWFAIGMIAMATTIIIKNNIPNIAKPKTPKHQPAISQESTQPSNDRLLLLLERQRQERAAQERARIQAQQAQQALDQQQNKQKLLQASEAALKEDAWNHYYKKTVECTNVDDMVTCGNTYIRNRQQFEYEWEHQRYKFR